MNIRRLLSETDFNLMTEKLMRTAGIIEKSSQQNKDNTKGEQNQDGGDHQTSSEEAPVAQPGDYTEPNKGDLKLDATVADQKIKYPNDVDLLNTGRQETNRMIDILCMGLGAKRLRTYRRRARKQYLFFAKKKNKTFKQIPGACKEKLGYLKRNLAWLDTLVTEYEKQQKQLPFEHRDLRIL